MKMSTFAVLDLTFLHAEHANYQIKLPHACFVPLLLLLYLHLFIVVDGCCFCSLTTTALNKIGGSPQSKQAHHLALKTTFPY
uniref:Uncharacterized protein n=1 Tax=Ditylenchus dipsaci TaxID=166011 RepID=A0A915EES9_9BILA